MYEPRIRHRKIRAALNIQLIFPLDDPSGVSQYRHTARFPPDRLRSTLHMKKTNVIRAILLAALPIASQGFGAVITPGTVAKVTIGLTLSTQAEGTVAKDPLTGKPIKRGQPGAGPAFSNLYVTKKGEMTTSEVDEYVSTISTRKYSNKELLLDLVSFGVITEVTGWSLVLVQPSYTEVVTDDQTPEPTVEVPEPAPVIVTLENRIQPGQPKMFLINKDTTKTPIPLEDFLSFGVQYAVSADKDVFVIQYEDGEPVYPGTTTFTGKFKGVAEVDLDLNKEIIVAGEEEEDPDVVFDVDQEIGLEGLWTGSEKIGTFGKEKIPAYLLGANKISNIRGSYSFANEQTGAESYSFVEGSISIAAGKGEADVSGFPDIFVMDN